MTGDETRKRYLRVNVYDISLNSGQKEGIMFWGIWIKIPGLISNGVTRNYFHSDLQKKGIMGSFGVKGVTVFPLLSLKMDSPTDIPNLLCQVHFTNIVTDGIFIVSYLLSIISVISLSYFRNWKIAVGLR